MPDIHAYLDPFLLKQRIGAKVVSYSSNPSDGNQQLKQTRQWSITYHVNVFKRLMMRQVVCIDHFDCVTVIVIKIYSRSNYFE